MRVHFSRRHVRDTVIILEEGNLPHPRCEECDMLVPWRSLNGRHKDTEMCRSGAIKKRRRETETEIRESTERAFEAYGGQLEAVDSFKYLGRVMTAGDDDLSPTLVVFPLAQSFLLPRTRSSGMFYLRAAIRFFLERAS